MADEQDLRDQAGHAAQAGEDQQRKSEALTQAAEEAGRAEQSAEESRTS